MRTTVQLLICDGRADSQGNIYKAEKLELPTDFVPVVLEGRFEDPFAYIGKAKIRLDGNIVLADIQFIEVMVPLDSLKVLFVFPTIVESHDKGSQKVVALSFTIAQHPRKEIGSILSFGVKP